ncbi:MAG: DUF3006 domain-containing protein [Candidatus Magasanikbacteria bacterium]|nr:DUF3006 domain-containing protein [Candidatus Magasanikbacteria bacterium]
MPPTGAPHRRVFNATIDRIEENHAVLELGAGETFNIPLAYMPDDATEGEQIRVTCERQTVGTEARVHEAKDLLNDILHSS